MFFFANFRERVSLSFPSFSFHPYMLNIKTPSQLYKEAHAATYAMIRVKGDNIVNLALDSRIERESTWTKKTSIVCESDRIFKYNVENKTSVTPSTETESEKKALIFKAKKAPNKLIKEVTLTLLNN